MRFPRSLTLAGLALALSAQAAWAGPDPVNFQFTGFGITVAGLPSNSVGPYQGSINGGASSFDVYCVDAMNFAAAAGQPFAAWKTRLTDPLDRTRLYTLGNAAGDPSFAAQGYLYMAYIANQVRLGVYSTDAERASAQLALWYLSMDEPVGGLYGNGVVLGQLAPGGYTGSIYDRLTEESPFLDCSAAQYDFCAVIWDAFDNAYQLTADWNWNDWVVYSDARWSSENACWSRVAGQEFADLEQNCIQEVIAYEVIPEPATMGLMGIGLVGLSLAGFRRRRTNS